jgi:hypothetical protein
LLDLYPLFSVIGDLHQDLWIQKHSQIGLAVSGNDTHPDLLLLDNRPEKNSFNNKIVQWMLDLK